MHRGGDAVGVEGSTNFDIRDSRQIAFKTCTSRGGREPKRDERGKGKRSKR